MMNHSVICVALLDTDTLLLYDINNEIFIRVNHPSLYYSDNKRQQVLYERVIVYLYICRSGYKVLALSIY